MDNEQIEKNNGGGTVNTSENVGSSGQEAEYITLPSRGIFFPGRFKGIEQLKVRKLNWEDEDILTTESYYVNGTLFNELLKNTIVDESKLPAGYLTTADKDAILMWLRIGAFGADYSVPSKCPSCGAKDKVTWDLGGFMLPDYPEEILDQIAADGCYQIVLPISKLSVKLVPPTIGKETDILKFLTQKKEKSKVTKDFNVTGRLLTIIKEATDAEGNVYTTKEEILQWLQRGYNGNPIPLVDSRYLREQVKLIDLEIDTKQDVVCNSCNHSQEGVPLLMTKNFFWPSK